MTGAPRSEVCLGEFREFMGMQVHRTSELLSAARRPEDPGIDIQVNTGVYAPQYDSALLSEVMARRRMPARVADLGTGTGYLAIAAARLGASAVTAVDKCPRAVACARENVRRSGLSINVMHGSWTQASWHAPFGLIVANPPYVPTGDRELSAVRTPKTLPLAAFDGGRDGRKVLDPLCSNVFQMLDAGGTLLLAQSEFAGILQSIAMLTATGLIAEVVAEQMIPFGEVMTQRAQWLESAGRPAAGRRTERIVVIGARKL